MTVKEMIEKLKKCKPGATVFVDSAHANTDGANVRAVEACGTESVRLTIAAEIKCY